MSREKIEEMARTLCGEKKTSCHECDPYHDTCEFWIEASILFNAGYRKQSEGEWIHDINNLYGCSKCLKRSPMSSKKMLAYCPNCGAKMKGGAE